MRLPKLPSAGFVRTQLLAVCHYYDVGAFLHVDLNTHAADRHVHQ